MTVMPMTGWRHISFLPYMNMGILGSVLIPPLLAFFVQFRVGKVMQSPGDVRLEQQMNGAEHTLFVLEVHYEVNAVGVVALHGNPGAASQHTVLLRLSI